MREILGNNLEQFFNNEINGNRTYKGNRYEVWEVSNEVYDIMCDMTEEKFVELAGEDAWWRSSEGSIFEAPYEKNIVNRHEMISWSKGFFDCESSRKSKRYESLSDYLCNCVGASQPRNVCALAMDLAKYNKMTMAELFAKYEDSI